MKSSFTLYHLFVIIFYLLVENVAIVVLLIGGESCTLSVSFAKKGFDRVWPAIDLSRGR